MMIAKSAFDCVEQLYSECLYDSVIQLAALLLTICERCPDFMTNVQRFLMTVYYAESLFYARQYKKAEKIFMRALHYRRINFPTTDENTNTHSTRNGKTWTAHNNMQAGGSAGARRSQTHSTWPSEAEINFQLYRCLMQQRKHKEAIGVLESIPTKARTARMSSALASLYTLLGNTKSAAEACKDVLRLCPYAVHELTLVLGRGVEMEDLSKTYSKDTPLELLPNMDWYSTWLEAHYFIAKKKFMKAVTNFKALDSTSNVSNNVHVLCALGKSYYYAGEYNWALDVLQRVHSLDPLCLDGMDILASILAEERRAKELESLATRLMSQFECSVSDASDSGSDIFGCPGGQPWIAMGYLCLATEKYSKALFFAHKACTMDPNSRESALLLKGQILLKSEKVVEATVHFREALAINPDRFEIHKGLVDAYLLRNQRRQAEAVTGYCVKHFNKSPRACALYASVLAKNPDNIKKAMEFLERVVASAPHLTSAVYSLVDIYDKLQLYEKGITLLRKQVRIQVNCKLHKLLGDFLMKVNKGTEALDRYRYALTLDPNNIELRRGMSELEDELRLGTSVVTADDFDVTTTTICATTTTAAAVSTTTTTATTSAMSDDDGDRRLPTDFQVRPIAAPVETPSSTSAGTQASIPSQSGNYSIANLFDAVPRAGTSTSNPIPINALPAGKTPTSVTFAPPHPTSLTIVRASVPSAATTTISPAAGDSSTVMVIASSTPNDAGQSGLGVVPQGPATFMDVDTPSQTHLDGDNDDGDCDSADEFDDKQPGSSNNAPPSGSSMDLICTPDSDGASPLPSPPPAPRGRRVRPSAPKTGTGIHKASESPLAMQSTSAATTPASPSSQTRPKTAKSSTRPTTRQSSVRPHPTQQPPTKRRATATRSQDLDRSDGSVASSSSVGAVGRLRKTMSSTAAADRSPQGRNKKMDDVISDNDDLDDSSLSTDRPGTGNQSSSQPAGTPNEPMDPKWTSTPAQSTDDAHNVADSPASPIFATPQSPSSRRIYKTRRSTSQDERSGMGNLEQSASSSEASTETVGKEELASKRNTGRMGNGDLHTGEITLDGLDDASSQESTSSVELGRN